ncbi:MAG: polymer-forming cytoskeletal protein, partial [Oscillospiraceae bacterium]
MANKETNNFKAALNELLSGKTTTEETKKPPLFKEDEMPTPVPDTSAAEEKLRQAIEAAQNNVEEKIEEPALEAPVETSPLYNEAASDISKPTAPTPSEYEPVPQVSVVNMQQTVEHMASSNETVIAHDVIIEGNIKSSSKLRIVGEVTGDVKSTADVVIEGKVG